MSNSNIDWNKRVYEIYVYEAGTKNKVHTFYTQAENKTEEQIKADFKKLFKDIDKEFVNQYDFYVLTSDPVKKKGK